MPRLIDADALKTELCTNTSVGTYMDCVDGSDVYFTSREVDRVIDAAPTIDPVRHGYWIKSTTKSLEVECVCSVCSGDAPSEYGRYTWIKSEYCPSCGCKMDGDAHD